jgi:hypothetical protein
MVAQLVEQAPHMRRVGSSILPHGKKLRIGEVMKILDLVKGTEAQFVCYRDGDLWYRIALPDDKDFEFPVPVADTGSGIFPARLKAITLMRWIRKHLERQTEWTA